MSGLEVAGVVLGLFPELMKTTQVREKYVKLSSSAAAEKSVELELRVALRKFRIWQEQWLGREDRLDTGARALWGSQGWATIQNMLKTILTKHQQIQQISDTLQASQAQSRWKLAIARYKKLSESRLPGVVPLARLKQLVQELNIAIDAVWLYSETAFDSLHGILKPDLSPHISRRLLDLAVTSRAGTLELFSICCNASADCDLDLDFDRDNDFRRQLTSSDESMSLSFAILPPVSMRMQERRVVVENRLRSRPDVQEASNVIDPSKTHFQLFDIKAGTGNVIIVVDRQQEDEESFLRIRTEDASPRSNLEKLGGILQRVGEQKDQKILEAPERLSVAAKTRLAYQIVETGFFLLGTPWLSLIKSQNVFRFKDNRAQPNFMLQVQTLGLDDLLLDDPEALSETEQLFHIGVLLMEIALDGLDDRRLVMSSSQSIGLLQRLPLVERSMGAQYCKATAFCLQRHQTDQRFKSPQKYGSNHAKGWQEYLGSLLQDYHEQVLLVLRELQTLQNT